MTTIAYKDGVIACDKQGTYYNQACKATFKAIVDDNYVYLITGTLHRGLRFIGWLQDNRADVKPPKLKGTVVYVFDKTSGELTAWHHESQSEPVEDTTWADGSGGQFAMGAMEAGCTPSEAVKIACKYDVYSGNGVQSWTSKAAKTR